MRCPGFCTRMHLITWDGDVPAILNWYGRELALIARQETTAPGY